MLGLPPSVRIYFATALVDMRNGGFQLPAVDKKRVKVEMEAAQLAMLLDGIDLNAKRLARWNPPEGIDTDPGS